jgi:outer membrane protein assembly factor BamB
MKRVEMLVWMFAAAAMLGVGADWRQFRGTDCTGLAPDGALAVGFKPDRDVAWKASLPGRGVSGPVIVGNRVFLTYSDGPRQDRLGVLALDARTGRRLWQRSFWATGPTNSHPKTCMAAPTPATDGRTLVAYFATGDVVGLDLDGNVRWVRCLDDETPGVTDNRGLASSPVIVGDTAVLLVETQNISFAAGIDLATGADHWRVARPRQPCWTSPVLLPGLKPGAPLVLLQGTTRLTAIDPLSGAVAWRLERESNPIASSVVAGNVLYVPGGKGLAAFELQGYKPPKLLWGENPKLNTEMASPLVLGERVYCLRGSIMVAADVKTGAVRSELRLKGPISASPVAAGHRICCVNEAGLVQLVSAGPKDISLVGSGSLGETILATPAIAGDSLYVRSDQHLWKIPAGTGAASP